VFTTSACNAAHQEPEILTNQSNSNYVSCQTTATQGIRPTLFQKAVTLFAIAKTNDTADLYKISHESAFCFCFLYMFDLLQREAENQLK